MQTQQAPLILNGFATQFEWMHNRPLTMLGEQGQVRYYELLNYDRTRLTCFLDWVSSESDTVLDLSDREDLFDIASTFDVGHWCDACRYWTLFDVCPVAHDATTK